MDTFFKIHQDLPRESPGGREYTIRAFHKLPPLHQPQILDIGCGPGAQTLVLAELSDGHITAIDLHPPFLEHLQTAAEAAGFQDRITCLCQSMLELNFPKASIDLIWAEGSIYIIGVSQGLTQWHPFLKPGGYLVFSDLVWFSPEVDPELRGYWQQGYPDMQLLDHRLQSMPASGYALVDHFILPEAAWWNYYTPLEARITHLLNQPDRTQEEIAVLRGELQEIETYRRFKEDYGYAFFVLQKLPRGSLERH
ncbi:MAG: class I SAM-dependent methyltransferase [Synechococcaceae cyanobacterium SM2_3_1]|nr:class I SAM-dependent methyltransferase [Synechococcaceae cyanobacterium SM2_3_1]